MAHFFMEWKAQPLPEFALAKGCVRSYRPGDEADWFRCCMGADLGTENWAEGQFEKDMLGKEGLLPENIFFAVDKNGVVAATAAAVFQKDCGYVHMVAADPAFRGRGFGKAVCLKVMQVLVEKGYDRIMLETDDFRGSAVHIYKWLGFERIVNNTDFVKLDGSQCDGVTTYPLKPFDTLLLSFSADTPVGTTIEFKARVRVEGVFTEWFSWGIWSPFADRHCIDSADELALIDTDTLRVKNGKLADAVQVKYEVVKNDKGEAPMLRSAAVTVKNTKIESDEPITAAEDCYVETPGYSQMVRDPKIGGVICSATTIAMLLAQEGETVLPEEIALHNYDSVYDGCGNWSYSTAIAAAYGYDAYLKYCSLDDLIAEIKAGNAVGTSVFYTTDPNHEKLPYMENAPCTTRGHLLVVCGFKTDENGRQWVIAHDPAAKSNAEVERFYPLDQFLRAWCNRVTYIVHKAKKHAPRYIPQYIPAAVKKTEQADVYELICDGNAITLAVDGVFRNTVIGWITESKGEKPADCDFAYGSVTDDGKLNLAGWVGQKLYVITNRGMIYEVN